MIRFKYIVFSDDFYFAWKPRTPLIFSELCVSPNINPLTAGAGYTRFFISYYHIQYRLLNMLKP